MRRRGFTLVELIVSIAILGLLVALLIPGISKVRAAGTNTKCQSNLRQLSVALMLYSQDNEYTVISRVRRAGGGIWSWPRFVSGRNLDDATDNIVRSQEYLAPGPVYACPIAAALLPNPSLIKFGTHRYYGYGMYIATFAVADAVAPAKATAVPAGDHKALRHGFAETKFFTNLVADGGIQLLHLQWVKRPAELIWMADVVGVGSGGGGNYAVGDALDLGNSGVNAPMAMFNPWEPTAGLYGSRVSLLHQGKSSVLYFDGHVEMLNRSQLNKGATNVRCFLTDTPNKVIDLTQ